MSDRSRASAYERARVLSLGAGVQSSTLLLLADAGEIPPFDVAVFADTGWEPQAVYDWLAYLEQRVKRTPIVRASGGNLREQLLRRAAGAGACPNPPLYLSDGRRLPRQCTQDFKVRPVRRALRERGYGPRRPVVQSLGITLDEVERARQSEVQWAQVDWPLIELRMTRASCLAWLEEHGHGVAPKSACIGCPFRSAFGWAALTPAERADAVEVDAAIRRLPGVRAEAFLHRDRVPLADVELRSPEERGQLALLDGECGGWCET